MEPDRCEYVQRRENVISAGNSGIGKTHVALGLGLTACQGGLEWTRNQARNFRANCAKEENDLRHVYFTHTRLEDF